MALDHPHEVARVAFLDIVPTLHMLSNIPLKWAVDSYHWSFMAQPYDYPEKMIEAYGFDKYGAYAGYGGTDQADLYDSAGNDAITMRHNRADFSLPSTGQYYQVNSFDRVIAHAGRSGADQVIFYDSPWNDTYTGGAAESSMVHTGVGAFDNRAIGFDLYYARSTSSITDNDVAILSDTAAGDLVRGFGWNNQLLVQYGGANMRSRSP